MIRGQGHQYPYASHPFPVLRARGERPHRRRAAEQRDQRAPV